MITLYTKGQTVTWEQDNRQHTGTILKIYEDFRAKSGNHSKTDDPVSYLILSSQGGYIVLPHRDIRVLKTKSR